MIKFRSIILFLIITAGIFQSCESGKKDTGKSAYNSSGTGKNGKGRIEFLKEIHNFGSLKAGEIVSFTFAFKNSGNSPLKITKCEATCGCIDIQYNKVEIEVGETSGIEIIFNTAGEWGNVVKTINVVTSSGEEKNLTIGAFIENDNFSNQINN